MKNILILIIGLGIGATGFWLISTHRKEKAEPEKAHAEEHAAPGVIKLDKKQQAAAGIETAAPEPMRLPEEVKGYGRVLDAATLVTMTLDIQAAHATADASQKEFERLKTLFGQGQNASARALETAEAAAKRDQTLVTVAEAKLRTTLGLDVMARKDLPELFEALAKLEWAMARIDIAGGAPDKLGSTVRVAPLANENAAISAELLGVAPLAESSIQGRGFLALIKTNSLPPNTAIIGWFEDPDHPREGFLIPNKALLQEGTDMIVIMQTGDDTFKKAVVEVDRATEKGAFITEGLAATNRVVISGAHQILSVTTAEPAD
jgi:hypothetical protein